MAKVADISTKLSLNSRDFKKGLKATGKNMEKFHAAFKKAALNVAKAGALAVAGGAAALITIVKKTGAAIDKVAKQSEKLGIPTEKLAALGHAAEQTGISTNNMTTGLQRMTRRIAEAGEGTGTAVKALGDLGISIDDIVALSPDQQFLMIADAMEKIEGQSDKVKLAFKLFDTEGVDLINTMAGGSAAVLALMKDAENLGLTFTKEQAAMVEASRDATDRMKKVFAGLFNAITIQLSPFIEEWANSMTEMGTDGETMSDRVSDAIGEIVSAFGWLEEKMIKTRGIFRMFAAELADVGGGLQAVIDPEAWKALARNMGLEHGKKYGWDKINLQFDIAPKQGAQIGNISAQSPAMQRLHALNPDAWAAIVQEQVKADLRPAEVTRMAAEQLRLSAGQDWNTNIQVERVQRHEKRVAERNKRIAEGVANRAGEALEKSIGEGAGVGPMTEAQWEVALLKGGDPVAAAAAAGPAAGGKKKGGRGFMGMLRGMMDFGEKWRKDRGLPPLKLPQIGEAAVFIPPRAVVEPWEIRRLQALDRGLQKFGDPARSNEEVRRRRALGLTRTEERFRMRQQREKLEDQVKARRRRADRLKEKELQINADQNKTLTDILGTVRQIAASKFVAFAE